LFRGESRLERSELHDSREYRMLARWSGGPEQSMALRQGEAKGVTMFAFPRRKLSLAGRIVLFAVACSAPLRADFDAAIAAVEGRDYARALIEFKALANEGDPRGENGLGALYLRGDALPRDLGQAFSLFKSAAEKGFAAAQANLALMYDNGWGTRESPAEAARWYYKAALNGNVEGQAAIGILLALGRGVERNFPAAYEWLKTAALRSNVQAQAHLGHLYRAGEGVSRDYVQAYVWYGLAAAGGYEMGPELRDTVAAYLSAAELSRAKALARRLYRELNSDS